MLPEDQQRRVCGLVRYRALDTDDAVVGFVVPTGTGESLLGLDVDAPTRTVETFTIAHEALHVRVSAERSADRCGRDDRREYYEDCLARDSLLGGWVDEFWDDELLRAWEKTVVWPATRRPRSTCTSRSRSASSVPTRPRTPRRTWPRRTPSGASASTPAAAPRRTRSTGWTRSRS